MRVFDWLREVRNGKEYENAASTDMSESIIIGNNPIMSAHENNTDSESKTRILTQEEESSDRTRIT